MSPIQSEIGITTRSLAALQAVHRFGAELMSHGCHAGVIFEALAHDPDCALAQGYAAAVFLTQLTRDGRAQATPRLAAAEALAPHATLRERQIIAAIGQWHAGDEAAAIRLLHDVVREYPHDLVSAKLCQILQLNNADITGMLRTASIAAAVESGGGYATGLLAFALEQAGETDRAEALAYRALDRNPLTDPWSQHVVAHVHTAREDWVQGRAFLRAHSASWSRCSSFMLTHNWWHLAICSLRLGDKADALRLYDTQVWGVRKQHSQDQINAVSLLARLEMHGANVGVRWGDVAAYVAPHVGDRMNGFLDLHYLYALARAGHDAQADAIAAGLADRCPTTGMLARGVLAHARRAWYDAAAAIGQARHRIGTLGGSQVQRALFEDMLVQSLSRMAAPKTRERLYA